MGSSTAIFWPVIVQVALIHVIYYLLFNRRKDAVRAGRVQMSQLRDNVGEPEETRLLRNNLTNQFELPMLFIAACIALYVTGNAGWVAIVLAWLFVALRIAHAVIHTGENRMRHRVPVFIWGFAVNGLLWLWLAVNIALV